MSSDQPVPPWLWRTATWGFGLALAGVIGAAWAVSRGWADPPHAGPRLWYDDFKDGAAGWEFSTPAGGAFGPAQGTLLVEFTAAGQLAVGLVPGPEGDFTLEVAGAQASGDIGAAYGLVFGWQDEAHYSAVVVNGNGYAEAYRQEGAERRDWFKWQQWPNILAGTAGNRVRVDVRRESGRATLRINDELLAGAVEAAAPGKIGVIARSPSTVLREVPPWGRAGAGPGRVLFSWVKVWTK